MPHSCYFQDCKALLVMIYLQTFTFTIVNGCLQKQRQSKAHSVLPVSLSFLSNDFFLDVDELNFLKFCHRH